MERLIPVVNKLQDAFAALGSANPIDLPQIAVVGGQSAGKSSVLENFVGKDFLPRGSGIVTRRPLVLQLINSSGTEYAEFLHKPNQKYTDFLAVRKEIEVETDRVTGSNKNISPLPINLRIYSPHVLNLTLVDLPGLTKVPVGDQPKDIDQQIKNMVTDFIANPNCLILAVTPANIDIANSDALLLARTVDPQGLRTIGVITKIDIMDRGTNCRDILLNITYPLKRGYVGVVNRGQADIDTRKDIKEAQKAEYTYFVTHEAYRDISDRCGTQHLQNVLHKQLTEHIRTTLPSIKKKLVEQVLSLETQLKEFSSDSDTPAGRARQLMTILQSFSESLDQNLGFRINYVQTDELSFGAKINKILTERFPYEIRKLSNSIEENRKEITISIQNAQGVNNTIFTPEAAFTTICRKKIAELRPVTLDIIDKVAEVMYEIIDHACLTAIHAYNTLQDEIKLAATRVLNDCISEAKSQANLILDLEYSYINTRHPDFIKMNDINTNKFNAGKAPSDGNEENSLVINTETNMVYRKGYLSVPTSGIIKNMKEYWFVIKGDNFQCFKDETERDMRYVIPLSNCSTRSGQKKNSFMLVSKDGKYLTKEIKFVDLYANNEEECEDWKASLMARGVFPEHQPKKTGDSGGQPATGFSQKNVDQPQDTYLFRQVELIRTLVEGYLRIVTKTQVDINSKLVINKIVEKFCNYSKSDLIAYVYSLNDLDRLMDVNESEKMRKVEMQKIYTSCNQALGIINDVMNNNISNYTPTQSVNAMTQPDRIGPNTGFGSSNQYIGSQTSQYGIGQSSNQFSNVAAQTQHRTGDSTSQFNPPASSYNPFDVSSFGTSPSTAQSATYQYTPMSSNANNSASMSNFGSKSTDFSSGITSQLNTFGISNTPNKSSASNFNDLYMELDTSNFNSAGITTSSWNPSAVGNAQKRVPPRPGQK